MINKSIYVCKYFDLPIGSELPCPWIFLNHTVVAFLLRAHVLALADPHDMEIHCAEWVKGIILRKF